MMREHLGIAAIAGTAIAASIALVIFVVLEDGDAPALSASPTALVESTSEASPVRDETATSTAVVEEEEPGSLYQPVAWDHPARVNRTPPSSLDQAIKESAVHADGWRFDGELPAVFGSDADDTPVCPAFPEGVMRAQSRDWVLELSESGEGGTSLPDGQRQFTLYPIDPRLLETLTPIEAPVRIRAIDTANWQATHLLEVGLALEVDGAYRFVFESPRTARWMAVVTAGPLWGCFTLDLEQDPVRWPAPAALNPNWYPDPPVGDDGSRVCVVATGQYTRSGQFVLGHLGGFGNRSAGDFSPFARASKVTWLPQYQDGLGVFAMRAMLATDFAIGATAEPVHAYELIASGQSELAGGELTYVTGPVLPRAGTWHIVATAAPYNLGCFTLTVGTE